MIHDKLSRWQIIPGFAQNEIWKTAFTWLEKSASSAAEGYHPLGKDGFVARVMGYPTKTRDQARYEMHREHIDIQYTIEGGEFIEIAARDSLTPLNDYAPANDVEFFLTPSRGAARVDNLPGYFTVLFAGEPHMPQLVIPEIATVRKVVIKIPVRLVNTQP
jgi:YhcH/YjgK/YiaL family protein